MDFDITLKEIFYQTPQQLLQLLVGSQVAEILTVEYPTVQQRRPDLVMRLIDGRIHHLELQSDNDTKMPWRMLEYYWLIYQQFEQAPIQQVLYVGQKQANFVTAIRQYTLHFRYQLIDIREIDCHSLVHSASLGDNLLAILCQMDNEQQTVRQILQRISALDENARQDAMKKLSVLLGLRPLTLSRLFKQEVKEMRIKIDFEKNPFFQEAFKKAEKRAEKRAEQRTITKMLSRLLEQRFGQLPTWALERINQANVHQLEEWSLKIFDVKQLKDVFKT